MTSRQRYQELENDPKVEISRVIMSEDNKSLLITWKSLKEEAGKNGNIVLAALTTAYARMALYKVILE